MATGAKEKAVKRQKLTAELRQLEREEQLAARADEACENLDNVACAWVAALRFRLGEIIDACIGVSACVDNPDATEVEHVGSLHLKTLLDLGRLHQFAAKLEAAEAELNKLLLPATAATIPDLRGAVWAADDALADRVGIRRQSRPGAPEAR